MTAHPKILFISSLLLLNTFVRANPTFAAGNGLLSQIGNLATTQNNTTWNYSSTNPQLRGQAPANSTVTITIDGTATTTTADATGQWTYTPTTLTTGTHSITIASTSDTYAFTLVIGTSEVSPTNTPTPTPSVTDAVEEPETLPQAGTTEVTLALLIGSIAILGSGYALLR